MLKTIGYDSLDALTNANVPKNIQFNRNLKIGEERGEFDALSELKTIAKKNKVYKSFIGMGYYGTKVPAVIQRNLLENPGWYTPYTPYQAEIAQGRLESLLNFQTVVTDLTKMDIANASLLDEATAAGEAMYLAWQAKKKKKNTFFVSQDCHPQTIECVKSRAEPLGVKIVVGDHQKMEVSDDLNGVLIQYPNTYGDAFDFTDFSKKIHDSGSLLCVATDLMALTMLKAPGEFGADVVLGNAQRFGVPMGYGGPHAAFFAVKDEYKRIMPGRLIGVSKDVNGDRALRMALQTREQHIRRETATSNICTAQALLANMAAMYAVYHGPQGLKDIAGRIHQNTRVLAEGLKKMGYSIKTKSFFDTITVETGSVSAVKVMQALEKREINIRKISENSVGISLDETVGLPELKSLFEGFAEAAGKSAPKPQEILGSIGNAIDSSITRTAEFLTHPTFNRYHSETEMMRYLKKLENRDISLTNTMIPLGSCTMKLNAASEMYPVTWPEFGNLHPFVPKNQAEGYLEMFHELNKWLKDITGFAAISLQPNSGSQGEYTGLRVIRAYLKAKNESHRDICLIPESAHGTNPASAVLSGFKIVVVKTDKEGNVDMDDLKAKADAHKDKLACLMITYPSTFGVYEEGVKEMVDLIHAKGGQVYMDGANMNAQSGLCSPGEIGADVCHLNLHKTFCIPHGGGGPGMGPIGVASHLAPFLPNHPVIDISQDFGGKDGIGPVSAAPFGSSSILPISYMYIKMMGSEGVKKATQVAILNANYMAFRLKEHYSIVYTKKNGLVAHEFILDFRPFKKIGVSVEDVAKRLIDYGFHAPTMAWPVHDTLMIEPTESEPLEMLDRLCDALISIRGEITQIEKGEMDPKDNPLANAPHTARVVISNDWNRKYSRELAAYPAPWTKDNKLWPFVGRIDSVYGDRNLICSCPPLEDYQ